jgi:predicted secreted protein
VLYAVFILCASGLRAGDTATFVDLGFSPDGRAFMFAQYGVQSGTLKPWADLFIVDVPLNNFVAGGRISYVHDKPVISGQDGSGALYRLLSRNASLAERHRIDHCFQGQPLYIALDNPPGPVEFRDFESGSSYRATLVSNVEGSGASLASSFYINLERTARDGSRKTYTVGTPQLKRPNISSYYIRKVMIAPQDGSLIMVIEMRSGNTDIRFMVEAVRL